MKTSGDGCIGVFCLRGLDDGLSVWQVTDIASQSAGTQDRDSVLRVALLAIRATLEGGWMEIGSVEDKFRSWGVPLEDALRRVAEFRALEFDLDNAMGAFWLRNTSKGEQLGRQIHEALGQCAKEAAPMVQAALTDGAVRQQRSVEIEAAMLFLIFERQTLALQRGEELLPDLEELVHWTYQAVQRVPSAGEVTDGLSRLNNRGWLSVRTAGAPPGGVPLGRIRGASDAEEGEQPRFGLRPDVLPLLAPIAGEGWYLDSVHRLAEWLSQN